MWYIDEDSPYGLIQNASEEPGTEPKSGNAFENPILFAGYYRDALTGLSHVRYRSYHPTLARWLQRDPGI